MWKESMIVSLDEKVGPWASFPITVCKLTAAITLAPAEPRVLAPGLLCCREEGLWNSACSGRRDSASGGVKAADPPAGAATGPGGGGGGAGGL